MLFFHKCSFSFVFYHLAFAIIHNFRQLNLHIYADQQETWQGFNPPHSLAQTSYPTSNSLMENVFIGPYNEEVPVLPSCDTAVNDIPQFLVQPCGTPWWQETDFHCASSNQEDFDNFPLAYHAGKPKVAWGMIWAAVKWRTVLRRLAAKRIARSFFNY